MKRITIALGLLLIAGTMRAQQPLPAVKFDDFAEGFNEPTDIENAGDDRLFVTEKAGSIKIADLAGNVLDTGVAVAVVVIRAARGHFFGLEGHAEVVIEVRTEG